MVVDKPRSPITQHFYAVEQEMKKDLLQHMVKDLRMVNVLVFSQTKYGVDKISQRLKRIGVSVVSIHSDHTRKQRKRALNRFGKGKCRVMVATNISARDVNGAEHVINYDVPTYAEDYVCQIGRAAATGEAITFVSSKEQEDLCKIGKFIGRKLTSQKCKSFSYIKSLKTGTVARNGHDEQIMHQCNTLFNPSMAEKKVAINLGNPDKLTTRLLHLLIKPGLRLIQFKKLEALFAAIASDTRPPDMVFHKILDHSKISVDFDREQLAQVPSEGPLIVVAYHKLVAVDGFAIASAIMSIRKDLKGMALSYLRALPDIKPYIIQVKQGNSKRAKQRNNSAFWKSMVWLKNGHVLVVFPSGQIAARKPLWNPHSVEAEWKKSLSLLIKGSKANVLPVSVSGETSLAFQIIRKIHPWTERFMMPGEVLAMKNETIRLKIGEPIFYDDLKTIGNSRELVDHLRKKVCDLEHQGEKQ